MFKFNKKLGETRGPAGEDKNGNVLKKYVPIEDAAEELLDNEKEFELEKEENEVGDLMSDEDFAEKEKEDLKNMSRKSGFVQGKGAAHVGPEFSSNSDEDDVHRKNNNSYQVTSSRGSDTSKDIYFNPYVGYQKRIENMKTIKKVKDKNGETSKLQRILRKTIGKFYDKQTDDEKPSWEDVLNDQKN